MTDRLLIDEQYVKNVAGVYVKSEPISAALVAAASTGQAVTKKADGTLELTTISGGGLTAPTLRSSAIQSSSASSYNVNFPTGATAGDVCLLMAGHGYVATNPSGWLVIHNLSGSNFNGGAWGRQLTAGDITTGYVTLAFGGTYNGVIAIACFTGVTGALRESQSERNSSGATTRSLASTWTVSATDYVLYFGANRANNTATCDTGTALQTVSASEASGVLTGGVPASGGVVTPTWSYSTTGTGDYQTLIAVMGT